ncbi:cytochrome P450 6k1-like [Arctopsyche grandis]|uniref:cytochrome P450 6k1-like n=1 Tax=Arctopsyche grandis TaxID=121162 RepID=UPI00406D772D
MITTLILFTSLIVTVYLYVTRNFNYWKDRGIVYLKPVPFLGNLGPIFTYKESIGEFLLKIYNDYKDEPYVGIFMADKPCLLVRDFELVNRVLKQDFQYFNNRILTISKKTDPIGARSLFSIHGKEWKNTRARLSPIFTTKKQKAIFDALVRVGNEFEDIFKKNSELDIKELSCCYTADSISDAVFRRNGLAMKDPENDTMRKLGNTLFEESINRSMRTNTLFLAPEIMNTFRISLLPESVYDVMKQTVKSVMAENPENRHGDYIDALLEMRKKGPWEGNDGEMIEPDDDNLASQLFMFFTAGFETAASGVIFTILEAARNPDIQEKLRKEIEEVSAEYDGQVTFEGLQKMTYLGKFVNECFRKHPPFPFVDRICTADYIIPGTNITIDKGTKLMIPIAGCQNDEKYYENPDKIIPERFDDIHLAQEKPFLPFSLGPRTCIGMRFGVMMIKVSIISAIRNHKITVSPKTPNDIRMSPKRFGNTPNCDVVLDIKSLNN